jgi:uncharacterized alpha/beta hydrolase family protein
MQRKEQDWRLMRIKVDLGLQSRVEISRSLHAGIQVLQAHFQIEMVALIGEKMSKIAWMMKILNKFGRREVQVLDATLSVHGRT